MHHFCYFSRLKSTVLGFPKHRPAIGIPGAMQTPTWAANTASFTLETRRFHNKFKTLSKHFWDESRDCPIEIKENWWSDSSQIHSDWMRKKRLFVENSVCLICHNTSHYNYHRSDKCQKNSSRHGWKKKLKNEFLTDVLHTTFFFVEQVSAWKICHLDKSFHDHLFILTDRLLMLVKIDTYG